jgi:hypothetical protein
VAVESLSKETPVVRLGEKLLALHWRTYKKRSGEEVRSFSCTEVTANLDSNLQVSGFYPLYGGVRFSTDTPVEMEGFAKAILARLEAMRTPRLADSKLPE